MKSTKYQNIFCEHATHRSRIQKPHARYSHLRMDQVMTLLEIKLQPSYMHINEGSAKKYLDWGKIDLKLTLRKSRKHFLKIWCFMILSNSRKWIMQKSLFNSPTLSMSLKSHTFKITFSRTGWILKDYCIFHTLYDVTYKNKKICIFLIFFPLQKIIWIYQLI